MINLNASLKFILDNDKYKKSPQIPELDNIPYEESKPVFKLHNSDLGKPVFINCNFSRYSFDFRSSKLTEAFSAGTQMPIDVQGDAQQKRLGHSQLKKVYENRGDTVEANEYFAREMNAYYEDLNWDWRKGWNKQGRNFEIVNLWLNKVSSNHGQSWQRALGFIAIVTFVFYGSFCYSLGYRLSNPTPSSWETFGQLFAYSLEFINPVHKLESFSNLEKNISFKPWSRVIDGISRIFITYGEYQLIQAFRKHGRK